MWNLPGHLSHLYCRLFHPIHWVRHLYQKDLKVFRNDCQKSWLNFEEVLEAVGTGVEVVVDGAGFDDASCYHPDHQTFVAWLEANVEEKHDDEVVWVVGADGVPWKA